MTPITKEDARKDYLIIHALEECIKECIESGKTVTKGDRMVLDNYKKAVRRWAKKENEEHIMNDSYDGYDSVVTCPVTVRHKREAIQYYVDNYYSEWYPSQYDCTGQKATSLIKVFKRNKRWHFWYHATYDL